MASIPEQAFVELQALYARLADVIKPFERNCDARGICCHFAAHGHMLFVTTLEAAEMARGGLAPDAAQAREVICPFQRGKLCGIREHRALGCRTYSCDSTYNEERNEIHEQFLKDIRAIESRHGIDSLYQRVTQINFEELRPQ